MKSESFKYGNGIDIPGYQISIMPSEHIREGNPIMLMNPKDYEAYKKSATDKITDQDVYGQIHEK